MNPYVYLLGAIILEVSGTMIGALIAGFFAMMPRRFISEVLLS
ncbi:hypothetical protein N9Y79_02505 [Alphaproteobacteria bacterium]|nr:hypothetical protein [Alphaproteobacteria bacterium]MDB2641398.1 hypothetical protein [Alphaproteobacteria bacterium]